MCPLLSAFGLPEIEEGARSYLSGATFASRLRTATEGHLTAILVNDTIPI